MMKPSTSLRFASSAWFLLLVILVMPAGHPALAQDSKAWTEIRSELYGDDRTIHDGSALLEIEAPDRAQDAALVPISIKSRIGPGDERYIKSLTIVIDENPAPVAGTFHFSRANGIADIATRVRVNAYSNIRAIAEMDDGQLYMAETFVKASGGCAAPATKNNAQAMARLGDMRMRQIGEWEVDQPAEVQLMISHPNFSGLQTDQVTQLWIPSHYVNDLAVSIDGQEILTFEGDISISENPSFNFFVMPQGEGELTARATDTKGNVFEHSWPLRMGSAS